MLRVLIHGASGRVGQALIRLCVQDPAFEIAAAIVRNIPATNAAAGCRIPYFTPDMRDAIPKVDVVIDFSLPQALDWVIRFCKDRSVPLVCGTTGFNPAAQNALQLLSHTVAVVWATNFSLGAAVLNALVAQASQSLRDWSCHVLESHHIHKKDAPSGTSLSLAHSAKAHHDRIEHVCIRAGDIVGDHTVQFTGLGERIELTHRAQDRDIFARGALHVAKRLQHCAPGRYQVSDFIT